MLKTAPSRHFSGSARPAAVKSTAMARVMSMWAATTAAAAEAPARTPGAERGRVSAAANAAIGGAQGVSLLTGGAVAAVLSPREIYALAGLLGVAVAIALAVFYAARTARTSQHVLPRSEAPLSS